MQNLTFPPLFPSPDTHFAVTSRLISHSALDDLVSLAFRPAYSTVLFLSTGGRAPFRRQLPTYEELYGNSATAHLQCLRQGALLTEEEMKFSKQLCASADLRYLQAYIAYKDLKKAIKLITGEDVECCTVRDVVSNFGGTSALAGSIFRPPESRFQDLLNLELEKINDFSRKKACDILAALDGACSRLVTLRGSLLQGTAAVSGGGARASAADAAAASGASAERAAAGPTTSASGAPTQQQHQAEDVFHSPATSEHSSSITGTGSDSKLESNDSNQRLRRGPSCDADCSEPAVTSSTSTSSNARGGSAGAAGGASTSGSGNEFTSSSTSLRGGTGGGGERSGGSSDTREAESSRSTLEAKEQQERASAAELLRVQQQLMELEGILEEQSGEIIFLDSYVRLNFTGFRKITKKYDKHNHSAAASWYMHRVVKQDFMKLNFTLLLARLASSYEALAEATQVYREQQTHTFDSLLEEPTPGLNGSGKGSSGSTSGADGSSSGASDGSSSGDRKGSGSSTRRKKGTPPEKGRPRTKQEGEQTKHYKKQVPLLDKERGQQQEDAVFPSVFTLAANQWTALQRAAVGESGSEQQRGAVSCLKYLVPPDMLMRVKVLVIQRYSLLAVHGLPVSLFANKGEAVSSNRQSASVSETAAGAAPAAAAPAAAASAGASAAALSRPSFAETSSDRSRSARDAADDRSVENRRSSLLQVTATRRSKSHRTSTLLDAAGGAAARAASWHVYLDSPQLSLYAAALANSRLAWDPADLLPAPDQPLLLPRIRWHGQSASLASPLSRVALELCRVDESSASPQEDITTICESNLPGKGCPPLTVVLQQRQLQELLRGEISSPELLQQLLVEETGGNKRKLVVAAGEGAAAGEGGAAAAQDAAIQIDVAAGARTAGGGGTAGGDTAPAADATTADAAAPATRDAADALAGVARVNAERRQQVQRVLDYVAAAVQRQHIAPCLRARFYRTEFRSKTGLLSLSLDEDIRFSRELGKPVPPSQWIRSETEALTTDDVQPFPWGVLDVSFLVQQEHQQCREAAIGTTEFAAAATSAQEQSEPSEEQLHFTGAAAAPSRVYTGSLQQPTAANARDFETAQEDLQDFFTRLSSLPNVVLVRGFSLFLHGVATLYTERLQEMQASQQQRQPQGQQPQRALYGEEEQDGGTAGEAETQQQQRSDSLLPHWLQYTLAMERQEENELTTDPREPKKAALDREGGGSAAAPQVAAAGTMPGSQSDTREPRREAGAGRHKSSKIDVVHKGTSASLVHEWQATLEEEQQPAPTESSFLERSLQDGGFPAAASYGAAHPPRRVGAGQSSENLAGAEGRDNLPGAGLRSGVHGRFGQPPLTLGEAAAQPPHQEGLRQPLLLQVGGYAAAEQETPSSTNRRDRGEGETLPTAAWIQKCGRHWLRSCTKKVCACCFPWENRRSARRLQPFRGGGGGCGAAAGAWGAGVDAGGAASAAAVRVEPKTFFANERTLLQWMNTAVLIATIAITLMNFGSPIGRVAGLVMSPVAVFFIAYSFWVYLRRARALERKEPINYNDKVGPTVLVVTLMCALSVVILLNVLYGGEEPPTASEASVSSSQPGHQASHTKNHSKYMRFSPVVSPQNEEDIYDEEDVHDEPQSTPSFARSSGRGSNSSSKKSLLREATAFYQSAAAPPPAYHSRQQRIADAAEEAAARAALESSAQDVMQATASNSMWTPVNPGQPSSDNEAVFAVGDDSGLSGSGVGATGGTAAMAGAARAEDDEIDGAGLPSRSKMVKASTHHRNSPKRQAALTNYYLQQEFEAAGHMPVRVKK